MNDDSGPEPPEEPTAARDGAVKGGESVADAATSEEEIQATEPPMEGGGGQLSLRGLGLPARTEVTGHVSVMSARREIDGRLDPQRDHVLIAHARVAGVNTDYKRADDADAKISSAAATQRLRLLSIGRLAPELEAAAALLVAVPEDDREQAARELVMVLERYVTEEERERIPALV